MTGILIGRGADIHVKDKDGLTALMWAEKNGHKNIVQLFEGK
ncbi:MAG: ankyrin repeat domain-containing protein [Desulfobacteraceae bacterium]|nr:ankyrin repeat domain-containing protein [Desulfobacteraceae bacterium]